LIGRDYPTKNFDLSDVHVWGASRIAEAVAKYDVDRFVHVSSHNADPDSASEFYRTKAAGEAAVRGIYPETTLVRPAPMFGWEDRLLNLLATEGSFFTSNNLKQRSNPVHAIDVGMALEHMLYDDSTASQTYELYGPTNYSMHEISDLVGREIIKKRRHINIPKAIRQPIAKYMNEYIWWPVGSADEVEREFIDQVIDKSAKTFADLGIEPVELEAMLYQYVVSKTLTSFSPNISNITATLSIFYLLRSATNDRKGKERRTQVSARHRRSIDHLDSVYKNRIENQFTLILSITLLLYTNFAETIEQEWGIMFSKATKQGIL
jgi:NADH dehydrogenase (ubiquinone) 1 alpha subcomplex subunit 9